jgi:hypothetical protein
VGSQVALVVTNALQTSAGRMIFGRVAEDGAAEGGASLAAQMGDAATHQPRSTARPPRRSHDSPRNPRR